MKQINLSNHLPSHGSTWNQNPDIGTYNAVSNTGLDSAPKFKSLLTYEAYWENGFMCYIMA